VKRHGKGGAIHVETKHAEEVCSIIMAFVNTIKPVEAFNIECEDWEYRITPPGQANNKGYDIHATTIVRFDYEKPEIRGKEWK
jgi:hypothetical protein